MRFLVEAGSNYRQEVEAANHREAVRQAFNAQLPLAIGEIICVRTANPKKKGGWDSAAYRLTSSVLQDVGCEHLYAPHGRGWQLRTEHPDVIKVESKEGQP